MKACDDLPTACDEYPACQCGRAWSRREALTAAAAVVVAAAAPPAAVAAAQPASPWRVFRVSDYEWYVARSPLEALQAAALDWGCRDVPADLGALLEDLEREGLTDQEPEQLDDAALDLFSFAQTDENDCLLEDEDGAPLPPISFREQLALRIAQGLDEPELFAAVDW